jgi:hypothetical protein
VDDYFAQTHQQSHRWVVQFQLTIQIRTYLTYF